MSSDSEDESMNLEESSIESDPQQDGANSGEEGEDDLKMNESNDDDSDEANDQDIGESDISSDDDDQEDDEESGDEKNKSTSKTVEGTIREKIIDRLKGHIGKQLYVRFNARLPEDEAEFQKQAKALSPLIIKANKPRQKHARFCLVDFETQKDRDAAFVKLRAAINKKDAALKGIVVSIPRTESEEFVESLIQKKLKAREKKINKARLKRTIRKSNTKSFTSTVLVRNLPANVSKAEMRSLFPNAVDIQMKPLKANTSSIATITLPTSKDAREAVKQNLSLGGTRLRITFHGGKIKRSSGQRDSTKNDKTKPKKSKESKIRKVLSA